MLTITGSVKEFESDAKFSGIDLWEEPEGFETFTSKFPWITHGRKGSGKTTLVDFLHATRVAKVVIILRPRQVQEFMVAFRSMVRSAATRPEAPEELSLSLDVLSHITIMRRVLMSANEPYRGDSNIVYEFLLSQDLMGPSLIRRGLRFIKAATDGYKSIQNLAGALDKMDKPTYSMARKATERLIKASNREYLLCIDDIDDMGFHFGPTEQMLVQSAITFCYTHNERCIRKELPLRVHLTLPTALFFVGTEWNSEKIRDRALHLHWSNSEKLQRLLNRRLAAALNVVRHGKLSVSTAHTWHKVFPEYVYNKRDIREDSFRYLLRHTFYTPRGLLYSCQAVLDRARESGCSLNTRAEMTQERWNHIVRRSVETFSTEEASLALKRFDDMYPGLKRIVEKWRSRPNIWIENTFSQFVSKCREGVTINAITQQSDDHLIEMLYQLGFCGFGVEQPAQTAAPPGSTAFRLHFSFLGDYVRPRSWTVAVIPPVFYEYLGIQILNDRAVTPNDTLVLNHNEMNRIYKYDVDRNVVR